MKKFAYLIMMLCLPFQVSAQKYIIDPWFADSLEVVAMQQKDSTWEQASPFVEMTLPKGTEVEVITFYDEDQEEALFPYDGKHWRVGREYLKFSDSNPADAINPQPLDERLLHSPVGDFFLSYSFPLAVFILIVVTMAIGALYAKFPALKPVAIVLIPVSILLVAIAEILCWYVLGNDFAWWCDPDTHGFFGALWRVIPFVIVAALQAYSIFAFELVIIPSDKKEDEEYKGLSLKPAFISIAIAVPTLIILALTLNICGFKGATYERLSGIIALVVLLFGTLRSLIKNMRTYGFLTGLLATLFCYIYIIAVVILGWMLIVIVFQLIIQLLIAIAFVVGLVMAFNVLGSSKGGGGGGGGGGGTRTVWTDARGNEHNSEYDARQANRRYAENG